MKMPLAKSSDALREILRRNTKMHNGGAHDADQNKQPKQCLRCLLVLFRQQEIRQGRNIDRRTFFLDKKLKLTHKRIYIYIYILRNVCDTKGDLCFPTDSGVCQTCFRNLEKVLKLDNNAKCPRETSRSKLQSTMER